MLQYGRGTDAKQVTRGEEMSPDVGSVSLIAVNAVVLYTNHFCSGLLLWALWSVDQADMRVHLSHIACLLLLHALGERIGKPE